jgi:hypothetical protein
VAGGKCAQFMKLERGARAAEDVQLIYGIVESLLSKYSGGNIKMEVHLTFLWVFVQWCTVEFISPTYIFLVLQ